MNEVKKAIIISLLKEYNESKSIHAACSACEILVEEIESGRLVL